MEQVLGVLVLVVFGGGAVRIGFGLGRLRERKMIAEFLWRQPPTRSRAQMVLDIDRLEHRKPPAKDKCYRPAPTLPYRFVERVREIAAIPEKEGMTTRADLWLTPTAAKSLLVSLETLAGGDLSTL